MTADKIQITPFPFFQIRKNKMKPEPRLARKTSTQFQLPADPDKHVMMCQTKAKSDKKLGKPQKKLAARKMVLRAEVAKTETNAEKEARRKKETERLKIWRLKHRKEPITLENAGSNKKRTNSKKKE